jgi:Protein of unknown function (DUF3443)
MSARQGSATHERRRWWVLAIVAALMSAVAAGCGGGSSSSIPSSSSSSSSSGSGSSGTSGTPVNNTVTLQVNAGPADNSFNEPVASVTICAPGTSNCKTISDVLVDTGSTGLRLLASLVDVSLPEPTDSSGNLIGNCVMFADGSYAWGSVATADVQLAGEKASSVPIQLIGTGGFPGAPSACSAGGGVEDNTVTNLGANGILGVGLFQQDCGPACVGAASSAPPIYFDCPSTGCSVTSVAVASQLQNPVGLFPQDNNGVLISLPSVPAGGSPSVSGSLIFGIGTQSNNGLGSAQVYTADDTGSFSVSFQGVPYSSSFLDTGSNGLFFLDSPTTGIPECASPNLGFYCPADTTSVAITTTGINGVSAPVTLSVGNADALLTSTNNVFNSVAGPNSGSFDLGLPFFLGRNVFVAIQGASTPDGAGPFWAY